MFKVSSIAIMTIFCVLNFESDAKASNDPFDWKIGFGKSLYEFESDGGKTISRYWDNPYYLLRRYCQSYPTSVQTTWKNKSTAYDRIKRALRAHEPRIQAFIEYNAQYPGGNSEKYTFTYYNKQLPHHGKLANCAVPEPVRQWAYWESKGSTGTEVGLYITDDKVSLAFARPAWPASLRW